jgi:HlyD family secretion protein
VTSTLPSPVRKLTTLVALLLVAACASKKDKAPTISTQAVQRRDIVIDAQATGVVEPISVVEVKSKASGQIVKMPVETGTLVKPGDLLVQIETRDTQNQYDQSAAALAAAQSKFEVSSAQKKRADELFKNRIITATEHEAAQIDFANAQSQLVAARTSTDLAKQRLEDATVRAPVAGTIIERTVALGTVITSATGAFGGGTTLLKMADLGQVRIRALFNETDIGQVKPGQSATVTVDAYPDRRFMGTVEKIEPQAVVQQNVTMFPVLVTLQNLEGLLKPGMNGETSVLVEQRTNVIAVPNDAVRNPREAMATAPMLGLNPDTVRALLASQMASRQGGGARQSGEPTGAPSGAPVTQTSRGEVALAPQQGQAGQGQGGGQGGPGGFQMPDVTDKECAAVTAAIAKKPAEQAKLDALRQKMMSGELDRDAMRTETQKIYAAIGVDPRVAGACRRRAMMQGGGAMGGAGGAAGMAPAGRAGAAQGAQGAQGAPGAAVGNRAGAGGFAGGAGGFGGGAGGFGGGRRARPGLVFVKKGESFEPRLVMLGASNFDYTEVVSGLQEGEQVAMLAAAALQAQRQQNNDRIRQQTGVPGMQQQPAGGGAGGGAGGARPGGAGGAGGGGAPAGGAGGGRTGGSGR